MEECLCFIDRYAYMIYDIWVYIWYGDAVSRSVQNLVRFVGALGSPLLSLVSAKIWGN